MKVTPLDIRRQEFNRKVRGLDPDEVVAFLEMVADEFEAVIKENTALKDRLNSLESQVAGFREMEKTLQDTIVTAQKAREEAKSDALKEAEFIVREAELKAERWIEEARQEVMCLQKELATLKGHKASFIAKMRTLLNSQSELLNVLELDRKELLQGMSSGPPERNVKSAKRVQESPPDHAAGKEKTPGTIHHEGEERRPSNPCTTEGTGGQDRGISRGRSSESEGYGLSGER